jgi:hypothetical protein
MKKVRRGEFDPSFTNAPLEEMAARVQQRGRQTARRNYVIILIFLLLLGIGIALGAYFYGDWVMATVGAAWQVTAALWNLQWWEAISILFAYKLSFLILGVVIGFVLFLFITFQVVETLVDLIGDMIASLFN